MEESQEYELLKELTTDELEYLLKKKEDRYGGYGQFVGMVINNSYDTGVKPDIILRDVLLFNMELDKVVEAYKEKKTKNIPRF